MTMWYCSMCLDGVAQACEHAGRDQPGYLLPHAGRHLRAPARSQGLLRPRRRVATWHHRYGTIPHHAYDSTTASLRMRAEFPAPHPIRRGVVPLSTCCCSSAVSSLTAPMLLPPPCFLMQVVFSMDGMSDLTWWPAIPASPLWSKWESSGRIPWCTTRRS